jgi:hypothetical protein
MTIGELLLAGTVSLTSFDGHCIRIDFGTRGEAEQMLELLLAPADTRPEGGDGAEIAAPFTSGNYRRRGKQVNAPHPLIQAILETHGAPKQERFTAGPWQSKSDYTIADATTIIANVDGDGHADGTTTYSYDFICTCEDEYGELAPNAQANARLIRTAPDLYEAAMKAIGLIEPLTGQGEDAIWRPANKAWEVLVEATRKARGDY